MENKSELDSIRINKEQQEKKPMTAPNESSGVRVEGHIKIWDPSTGEVILRSRT